MESKENPELNLEKQKVYRFQIGIVLGLSLALVAFEWSQVEHHSTIEYIVDLGEEEEIIINYKIIKEKIPELKEPKKKPSDLVNPVVDIVKIEEPVDKPIVKKEPTEFTVKGKEIDYGDEKIGDIEIFTIVEQMPVFIGGEENIYRFLGDNVKYPYLARDAKIQGVVYVSFIIMEDGSISEAKILRGIGAGFDEEALRVINGMPRWSPSKQRGRPVRVQFNMPIHFKLKKG